MSSTRATRYLNAPRPTVYRALLDGHAVGTWMVPDGMTSQVHAFDGREGGTFRISLTYDGAAGAGKTTAHTDTFHGRFVKLVPDERVVEVVEFETSDPAMQGEMTIEYTLADAGGGTDLVAVHDGLPPGVSAVDNELGWRMSLDNLAAFVEGRAYTDAKEPFIRRAVNMRMNKWRVAIEPVDQPEAIALVRELDAHLEPLYPPEARHGLNLEALRSPNVLFVLARDEGGMAHGCGALALSAQHAELKRMYVRSASRGLGVADSVVGFLEGEALRRGYDAVVLETGIGQPAAISFYERIGYVRRGPFGKYEPNGFSVFMEKRLRG